MRCLLPLLLVLPSITTAYAAEQARPVSEFQSIRSEGVYKLNVTVGPAPSVSVSGDEALFDKVEVRVSGGELLIRYKGEQQFRLFHKNNLLVVNVTTPTLKAFSGAGVGSNVLSGVAGDTFTLNYEGVGEVIADGTVKQLSVQASGTGSIDLSKLKAANTAVSFSGVGEAKVYASESLKAAGDGIGSIVYYGHPAKVSKSSSGIGSVSAGD
jgi:hypothetical protein